MKPLQTIAAAASKIAPGKAPHFIEPHIVKTLTTIKDQEPVGRVNLAKTTGLGEGSIRTLIRHLEKEKLVVTSREGIMLTSAGRKLVSELTAKISHSLEVPKSSLTVGAYNVAILVKDAAPSVRAGLEQRDAAIKVGAQGATTLVFSHGKWSMPNVEEDVLRNAQDIRNSLSALKPEENDAVVIGSAKDKLMAEYGAIAGALETIKTQKP